MLKAIWVRFFIVVAVMTGTVLAAPVGEMKSDDLYDAMVQEAHKFDPLYANGTAVNREEAVRYYRLALSARPDDPRNIEVEHRIAQLYAFYGNPKTKERPMPEKAAEAYEHIIETYQTRDMRWVQCHIGLASCKMMLRKLDEALPIYEEVLSLDPEALEVEPDERESVREQVGNLRVGMVDKIAFVTLRLDPEEGAKRMREIALKYPATDMARRAKQRLIALEAVQPEGPIWGLDIDALTDEAISEAEDH